MLLLLAATATAPISLTLSETAVALDAVTAAGLLAASRVENGAGIDTVSLAAAPQCTLSDTMSVLDTTAIAIALPVSLTETGAALDAPSASLSVNITLSDTLTILDTSAGVTSLPLSIAESGIATDAPSAGATTNAVTTEAAIASETPIISATVPQSLPETVVATDSVTAGAHPVLALSEAAAGVDLPASITSMAVGIDEILAASDTAAAPIIFSGTMIEAAPGMTDTISVGWALSVIERLNIVDHVGKAGPFTPPERVAVLPVRDADTPPLRQLPTRQPDEVLDYLVDATLPLTDTITGEIDPLVRMTLAVMPSGAGEMAPSRLSVDPTGLLITFWLSGGVPGRNYIVNIEATTAAGRVFQWPYGIRINPWLAVPPYTPPPSTRFDPLLVWPPGAGLPPSDSGLFWPFGGPPVGPFVPLS